MTAERCFRRRVMPLLEAADRVRAAALDQPGACPLSFQQKLDA
jgi:hypothetical protein